MQTCQLLPRRPGAGLLVLLVLVVALGSSCRREAAILVPPVDLRELEWAHLYLGGEAAPAVVYEFPRDLGEVADLVGLYNRARLGGQPSSGPRHVRLVLFRHARPPVALEALAGGQLVLEHPEVAGPRQVVSAALWQALANVGEQARLARPPAPPGTDPDDLLSPPRVVRAYLNPEPPAPDLALIVLQFDRPMNWASVTAALTVDPAIPGVLSHQGESLLFFVSGYPSATAGESFTLAIAGEARAADGQPLGEDYRLSFRLEPVSPSVPELKDTIHRTLAGPTLSFERVAGAGAAWTWLAPGVPPQVGAGATVFTGEYVEPYQAHYLCGDETTTLEGYRRGDRLWLREEVAGEAGPWAAYGAEEAARSGDQASFLKDLLDPGRWGGIAELARVGTVVRLGANLLGVRLPSLDARLGMEDEWEEGRFVSYSLVVRLGKDARGEGPVVEEIACRLVYHRPDDAYPFSYFDDVSRFRVGGPLSITFPAELGP